MTCQDDGHHVVVTYLPAAVGPLEPVRVVCERCGRIWDVVEGRGGVEPAGYRPRRPRWPWRRGGR